MVAVVSRLELETGDLAYPVAYFSPEEIAPAELHQFWTRPELWFKTEQGGDGWIVKNDAWDFELAPHIAAGTLRWVCEGADGPTVAGAADAECPYVGLPGERRPQAIAGGEREWMEPPSGEPFDPFREE